MNFSSSTYHFIHDVSILSAVADDNWNCSYIRTQYDVMAEIAGLLYHAVKDAYSFTVTLTYFNKSELPSWLTFGIRYWLTRAGLA